MNRWITLDDAKTRDMDDAFMVDKADGVWTLKVAIADVSRAVKPHTETDIRAREATATRYFASGNSPMLPRSLSDSRLSLWNGKERQAVVVTLKMDKHCSMVLESITLEKIVSQAKLSYSEVPSLVQSPLNYGPTLAASFALASALMRVRRANGAMVLYDLNNGWLTTEEGFVRKLKDPREGMGQIIIQEFMIAANAAVAAYAVNCNIPVLFRNHEARLAAPNRQELMDHVQAGLAGPIAGLETMRERTHLLLNRAEYGATLKGHYGLNLPAYLHFTSPIRRYADLIVHRQIVASLNGEPLPYSQTELTEIAEGINRTSEKIREEMRAKKTAIAEARADRYGSDPRRLDGLNAKDFERVVKVQARSGSRPTEALEESISKRLADQRMPIVCMTALITEAPREQHWDAIRSQILAYLAKVPNDSVSLLAQASQISGWPEVEFVITEHSDQEKIFLAKARTKTVSAIAVATTAKLAKQRSAVVFLAKALGLESPIKELLEPPPAASKDPVSALQEFCQVLGGLPEYRSEIWKCGFVCFAEFRGTSRSGTGSSKRAAKKVAASELLLALKGG